MGLTPIQFQCEAKYRSLSRHSSEECRGKGCQIHFLIDELSSIRNGKCQVLVVTRRQRPEAIRIRVENDLRLPEDLALQSRSKQAPNQPRGSECPIDWAKALRPRYCGARFSPETSSRMGEFLRKSGHPLVSCIVLRTRSANDSQVPSVSVGGCRNRCSCALLSEGRCRW